MRAAAERTKPNAERLREYTDAALPELQQQLEAPIPIHNELEELTLSFGLDRMREYLGPDYPLVQNLLKEDSPDALAQSLVAEHASSPIRPCARRCGRAARRPSTASEDPMIRIARAGRSGGARAAQAV